MPPELPAVASLSQSH
uniref:Uncharacterized protein n=1 Tax=Arundo donax TaxID=35708 RepID=A0A0A9GAM8_ARUDO